MPNSFLLVGSLGLAYGNNCRSKALQRAANPSKQRNGRSCSLPRQLEWVLFDTEPELCPSSQRRGCGVNERRNKHVRGQPRGRSQAVPSRMGSTRQGRLCPHHTKPSFSSLNTPASPRGMLLGAGSAPARRTLLGRTG